MNKVDSNYNKKNSPLPGGLRGQIVALQVGAKMPTDDHSVRRVFSLWLRGYSFLAIGYLTKTNPSWARSIIARHAGETWRLAQRRLTPNFFYILRYLDDSTFKVGITQDPDRRIIGSASSKGVTSNRVGLRESRLVGLKRFGVNGSGLNIERAVCTKWDRPYRKHSREFFRSLPKCLVEWAQSDGVSNLEETRALCDAIRESRWDGPANEVPCVGAA